ncbi:MAG: hypothetical protein RL112_1080, partial [Planctomycetota bacterium]
ASRSAASPRPSRAWWAAYTLSAREEGSRGSPGSDKGVVKLTRVGGGARREPGGLA